MTLTWHSRSYVVSPGSGKKIDRPFYVGCPLPPCNDHKPVPTIHVEPKCEKETDMKVPRLKFKFNLSTTNLEFGEDTRALFGALPGQQFLPPKKTDKNPLHKFWNDQII